MPAAQYQDLTLFDIYDDSLPLAGYGTADTTGFLLDPGDSIVSKGGTLTRASTATYIDVNGIVRTAAAAEMRNTHYINGVRYFLIENSRAQLLANPQAPSAWVNFGTPIITLNQPDPWGGANAILVQDDDAAAREGKSQAIVFTSDGTKAVGVAVRAGTANRIVAMVRDFTAGSVDRHAVAITWNGGLVPPTCATQAGAGTIYPPVMASDWQGNIWWLIFFTATGVIAANVNQLNVVVDPTVGGGVGTFYLAGGNAWNAGAPASWQSSASTRQNDILNFPQTDIPQEATYYVELYSRGPTGITANERIFQIGVGATTPRLFLFALSSGRYRIQHENGVAVVTADSQTPAYGDIARIRAVLYADGSVQMFCSLNGAAEVASARSAANALAPGWSDGFFHIGNNGGGGNVASSMALRVLRWAPGVKSALEMQQFTGIGNIIQATFSTDPAHPRPYLKYVGDIGESAVDFLSGGSTIGQMAVEIVDARRDPVDQDTGLFTYLLAGVNNDTQILGIRAVFRQQKADGTWDVVFDGVVGPITMPKLTTFRLQLRDARERERGMRLFTKSTNTCIFPRIGPAEGFGYRSEYDPATGHVLVGDPVMPRIKGIQAMFKDLTTFDNGTLIGGVAGGVRWAGTEVQQDYEDLLKKFGEFSVVGEYAMDGTITDPGVGMLGATVYKVFDCAVEWSTTGNPGTYTRLEQMLLGGYMSPTNVFNFITRADGKRIVNAIAMTFTPDDIAAGKKPVDGAMIWVRVVSSKTPTDEVPLYIEEPFGTMIKRCYDGEYTKALTTIPVRYDAAQMDIMARATEIARARITKPEDDLRQWIQEHGYRPCGWAPSIRNGRVFPIEYEVPDSTVEIVQLDDSNTIRADWLHGPDNVINQVVVEYEREIVPNDLTAVQYYKPRVQKVIIERDRLSGDSQRRHGTKPQTLKPVTIRSVVSESESSQAAPAQEVGALISSRRGEEVLRRFTNGAQVVEAECRRTAAVDGLREGDWVAGAWSWLPDYVTHVRSMNRLMQVMRIRRAKGNTREFLLLDAGPYDQPVDLPALGALVEEINPQRVRLPVTAVPVAADSRVEVQYAFGEVQPANDSGEWITAGYRTDLGNLYTLPFLRPAALIWARARGTADGRRASAWTAPISLRLSAAALLRGAEVRIESDSNSANYGKPIVSWEPLAGTGGVRIFYELHAQGTNPPTVLTNSVDADATALSAVLPVTLTQFQQVTVQVVGYPGFAAGAVTGAASIGSQFRTASRQEIAFVLPTITEDRTQDNTTGTLVLNINDPQGRVTKVEFRTKVGDAGAWSAWVQDAILPYGTSVSLLGNQTSLIEYRVTGYDTNGALVILWQAQVAYNSALVGFTEVVITQTASSATQVTYQVTTRGGAGDGTGTVTLVALAGSASISSGAAVGTPVASGSSWTFNRGAPASTDGAASDALATFRAIQTGYQTDDDMVVIPPRGVDTRSLAVRATVQSTSATQIVVRVAVADPVAQSALNVSVAYVSTGVGTISPASPQTILSANVTNDLATTGTVDFTINRPVFQAGTGRIVFTATRTNRVADLDAVDVPAQERDTQSLEVRIERVSESGTQIVVRVKAIRPNTSGAISIAYDNAGLTVSPASPQSIVSGTSDFATTGFVDFTITKQTSQQRRVAFTASVAGFVDATDGVDVVPATAQASGSPSGTVTPNTTSRTRATEVLDIVGTLGTNDPGPIQWRVKVDDAAFGALGTVTPVSVTRGIFWHRHVQVEFVQSDGQKALVPFTVLSALEPLDDILGRFKRSVPMTDGNYPLVSTTSDGNTAGSSVVESGLKFINKMYAKPLSSSADTADSVVVGILKRIPLLGGTDVSGNLDLAGTAWVNKNTNNLNWTNITPPGGTWSQAGLTFAGGKTPANTIDSDVTSSKFHTDTAVSGAELRVDYGSSVTFDSFRFYVAVPGISAANWTIEYWNGSAWITLKIGVIAGQSGWNVYTFARTSALIWRIRLTNTPGAGPWCNQVEWVDSLASAVGHQVLYSDSQFVWERAINMIKRQSFSFRDVAKISDDVTAANTMYSKPLSSSPNTADSINNGSTQRAVPFTVIRTSDNALVTKMSYDATIGNYEPALTVSKRAGIFWSETFEEILSTVGWVNSGGAGAESLISTIGVSQSGKKVYQYSGTSMWKRFPFYLPFNSTKLYRIRFRLRCTVDATAGNQNVYIGLHGRRADATDANNNGGYMYVGNAGPITVAMGWVELTRWFKGASLPFASGSPVPSGDRQNPTALSVDTVEVAPVCACNYPSGAGTYQWDYVVIEELDEDASMSFSGQQTLALQVGQTDGVTVRAITKGHVSGTGRHGATVTFPNNFQNVPLVLISGGISHEPRAKWGATGDGTEAGAYNAALPTYADIAALNLTASGFTLRARLKQKGAQTARSANADTANNSLTSAGASAAATLNNAASGASADYYQINYKISVDATNIHGGLARTTAVLAIDSSSDGGSTWVQRASFSYESICDTVGTTNTEDWTFEAVGLTVSGLSSTATADKLRIRIVSITKTDGGSVTAHLFSTVATIPDPAAALLYNTTSGDQFANRTPDADDIMKWEALETS